MSNIGKLIETYQDRHGTSDRGLARRVGVTATLVGRWKKGSFVEMPKPDTIRALAAQMAPIAEEEILDAFLLDTGYKREDVTSDVPRQRSTSGMPAADPAESSATQDDYGLAADDQDDLRDEQEATESSP